MVKNNIYIWLPWIISILICKNWWNIAINCRWRHKFNRSHINIIFTTGLDSKRLKDVILELIIMHRYSRACGSYHDVLDKGLLLTRTLLNQVFLVVKLMSPLRKSYDRHYDLANRYWVSVSQMTMDMFLFVVITIWSFPHSWLITGFATRVTRRVPLVVQKLLTPPEHLSSPSAFSVARSLVFCAMFCR